MPSHPDQSAAMDFIRQCIDTYAERGPAVARVRYTHVPPATWGRWLKAVRTEALMSSTPATPATPPASVPAPTSVPYTGSSGEFRRHLDIAFDSADAMLAQGLRVDPATGQRRVVNPLMVTNSTRMRVMAAAELAKFEDRMNDAEENKRRMSLYNKRVAALVVEAVAGFGKELGHAVVERIIDGIYQLQDELNAELGITRPGKAGRGRYLFPRSEPTLSRVRDNTIVSIAFHEKQLAAIAVGELTYQEALDQKEPRQQ